jgi:hypothetical protein
MSSGIVQQVPSGEWACGRFSTQQASDRLCARGLRRSSVGLATATADTSACPAASWGSATHSFTRVA